MEKEREMYKFSSVLQQLFIRYMARTERTRVIKGKEQWKKVKNETVDEMKGEERLIRD